MRFKCTSRRWNRSDRGHSGIGSRVMPWAWCSTTTRYGRIMSFSGSFDYEFSGPVSSFAIYAFWLDPFHSRTHELRHLVYSFSDRFKVTNAVRLLESQ